MSLSSWESGSAAPGFPALEEGLRAAVAVLEGPAPDALRCAGLLLEIESLGRLVDRARILAARAADQARVIELGRPGTAADPHGR
ncbi:hypothetical protein ACETWP_17335, partial [Arthrobacter halodurans]